MSGPPPAPPPDLATRVRALPAIAGLSELWQQARGETDAEYAAFVTWITTPERGAPDPEHMAAAAKWEWAERALAVDRANSMQISTPAGTLPTITAEHVIVKNLMQMVQLETSKLLQQSAQNPQSVVGLKDIIATVGLITELQKAGNVAAAGAADISKLTTEQKKTILEARRLLQGLK